MKFITITFIVFFSLALTNTFSIFSERYPVGQVYSGGWYTEVEGSFQSREVDFNTTTGYLSSVCTGCCDSDDICFSASPSGQYVIYTYHGLVGGNGGSDPIIYYESTIDSTGFTNTQLSGECVSQ